MIHPWHDVTPGDKLPAEFNTVIEIPFGSSVKLTGVAVRISRSVRHCGPVNWSGI